MYFQPEAFIHTYGAFPTAVLSQTCSRIYQLNYEPTSAWEKAQRAWCFSPWYECMIMLPSQKGMNRLQNCVMNVQGMLTCTYHPKPHAVISVYGWRSQARKAAILVSPKGPPFNIQITLLRYCVRFWKIN